MNLSLNELKVWLSNTYSSDIGIYCLSLWMVACRFPG